MREHARARQVCARFPPVMHHFFLEHHRAPAAWFEARLCYTRATAVGCMAGHVIGLGDRHSHNILLHARSGAVVHIDLGIAFEQGRFLTTPELVPFRLTRDVVDGMGAAGARARRDVECIGFESASAVRVLARVCVWVWVAARWQPGQDAVCGAQYMPAHWRASCDAPVSTTDMNNISQKLFYACDDSSVCVLAL